MKIKLGPVFHRYLRRRTLFLIPLCVLLAAAYWFFLGGGRGGAGDPVPYLEECLTEEELMGLDVEKYRTLFDSDRILNAMSTWENGSFRDWDREMRCQLAQAIDFYEDHNGYLSLPYRGSCVIDGEGERCYDVASAEAGVTYMQFHDDYTRYLTIAKMAWHLFVEANRLTPWSIFSYSDRKLALLFGSALDEPRIGRQYFTAEIDIPKTYRIVTGSYTTIGTTESMSMVGANAMSTTLNVLEFIGKTTTHFTGSSRITMGIDDDFWPYSARNEYGATLYDEEGIRVPLDRLPTTEDILIRLEPHHDNSANYNRAKYHIVGGCWATSVLIKNMLASINIPVDLTREFGSYYGFAGHSGVIFPDIGGQDYHLIHADNLYSYGWAYGLLEPRGEIDATEMWETEGFLPFGEYLDGYGVLHDEDIPWYLSELGLDDASIRTVERELRPFIDFSMDFRILAARSIEHPSIQSIYRRCASSTLASSEYLPVRYLTDEEERRAVFVIDNIIAERRAGASTDNCLMLFLTELSEVYSMKTNMHILGDEDRDGKMNFEDVYPYTPDPDVSPDPEEFWDVLSIHSFSATF